MRSTKSRSLGRLFRFSNGLPEARTQPYTRCRAIAPSAYFPPPGAGEFLWPRKRVGRRYDRRKKQPKRQAGGRLCEILARDCSPPDFCLASGLLDSPHASAYARPCPTRRSRLYSSGVASASCRLSLEPAVRLPKGRLSLGATVADGGATSRGLRRARARCRLQIAWRLRIASECYRDSKAGYQCRRSPDSCCV